MKKSAGDTDVYVLALRTSTDRARNLLYVVAVATVLIFAVHHNIQADSWPRRRLDAWYQYVREDGKEQPIPSFVANGDRERLKGIRDEYVKQFASRVVFAGSPLPGVAMDVNDLPLIGGLALALLMLLLAIAISREHENLYLALYKVRLIAVEEGASSSHGGSRANLLYHALAMTQMLNSPPTLARWKPHRIFGPLWRVAFLIPFAVYWSVVQFEAETAHVTQVVYGIDAERDLRIYLMLALALFVLGLIAWAHTSAMAERWDRAFLRLNPARRVLPQMSIFQWMRVPLTVLTRARLKRQQLSGMIVDALQVSPPEHPISTVPVEWRVTCPAGKIRRRHVREMRNELMRLGTDTARRLFQPESSNAPVELTRFAIGSSRLEVNDWVVSGMWTVKLRG